MAVTRIIFSTKGTGLGKFSRGTGKILRKDFIRNGVWKAEKSNGMQILEVNSERLAKWQETFKLMRERGISVPLTVDHIQVRDPKTGKTLLRKMTPGMAEAKRGEVVNLFADGGVGFCEVMPADEDAETLMNRCPEVSLELETDFMDGYGNKYPEAITAITLTPVPVMPGQQMEWEQVTGDVSPAVAASRDPRDANREITCMSAEPFTAADYRKLSLSRSERSMSPTLMSRLRAALGMHTDPEEEVHAKCVDHMERCARGSYMSREDHDKEIKALNERVTTMSRELETAKAGTRVLTVEDLAKDVDEDALDMAATGFEARIKALGPKATPAQKALLMSKLVGEKNKRNVLMSRKTATKVGLPAPLAEMVLEIFEAGDVAEMTKLLNETSKGQRTELSRQDPSGGQPEHDPAVTKRMIENANAHVEKATTFQM